MLRCPDCEKIISQKPLTRTGERSIAHPATRDLIAHLQIDHDYSKRGSQARATVAVHDVRYATL